MIINFSRNAVPKPLGSLLRSSFQLSRCNCLCPEKQNGLQFQSEVQSNQLLKDFLISRAMHIYFQMGILDKKSEYAREESSLF